MRKSKLALGLVTGLTCVMALASCEMRPEYSPEGYILTYTDGAGEVHHYTAEDLFESYLQDSDAAETIFNETYKLIVRNYFNVETDQKDELETIKKNANNQLDGAKREADKKAKENNTKYKDEFQSIIESNGCHDEDDLLEKYIYDGMKAKFEDNFYNDNLAYIRDNRSVNASPRKVGQFGWSDYRGYLQAKVPHHVRHLLVKIDDTNANNYYNAEISEENAKDLADIADSLAQGDKSFGEIAQTATASKDTGSKNKFGDLGIMDRDTGFVNEFKLGLYVYDALYNKKTNGEDGLAAKSEVAIPTKYIDDVKKASGETIGTIPFGAFEMLRTYKDIVDRTEGEKHLEVNHGKAFYFPRNIIFNKYFNKHNICVITPNELDLKDPLSVYKNDSTVFAHYEEKPSDSYAGMKGFKEVDALGKKVVLCDEDASPILVVRGGSGGDSGYQGLHFITVVRNGLFVDDEINGTTLSEYYTTKWPGQKGYPKDEDKKDKDTYVNYLNVEPKALKARAEEVESKIKGFDHNLTKYIFRKYYDAQSIKYKNEKIEKLVLDYIDRALVKADLDKIASWERLWREYYEKLEAITKERKKCLPEVCAIGYQDSNDNKYKDLWREGGLCGEKVNG